MEFEEFAGFFNSAQAQHEASGLSDDFTLFDRLQASVAELEQAESALGARLPAKYKEFMRCYGGGMCAFMDILPVVSRDGTRADLLSVNEVEGFAPNFVAVAPTGTGDWWGFELVDGVCRNHVSFIYHEDGVIEYEASDFLTFVAKRGLRVEAA